MIKELIIRKEECVLPLESIYFGGGTPSILSDAEIVLLFEIIYKYYPIQNSVEVSFEANPDDLTLEKIQFLKTTPINRFSIGIQSFFEDDLRFMNRAHSAKEAILSIENVKNQGFENLTIDLIYGVPESKNWEKNLEIFYQLAIPHLSSYALTVEPKTILHHQIQTHKVQNVNEEQQEREYKILIDSLASHQFEQYEISNFARNKQYSLHNTNYWKSKPYIGIGPSAHSYDGTTRSWNIANNAQYCKQLNDNTLPSETEVLSENEQYNELVMLGLRTQWGVDLEKVEQISHKGLRYLQQKIPSSIEKGILKIEDNHLIICSEYRFLADGIAADLFYID